MNSKKLTIIAKTTPYKGTSTWFSSLITDLAKLENSKSLVKHVKFHPRGRRE